MNNTSEEKEKSLTPDEQTDLSKDELKGSIESSLYGFAVGDALGVPVEFLSRKTIQKNPVTGMLAYGTHHQPAGTWSDDTSMTIAAMDSIAETNGAVDYENIMSKYGQWYHNELYTANGDVFDIGNTTFSAIHRYDLGTPATACGDKGERCNGNGSLMRMLPLVFALNNETTENETQIIQQYSGLTHRHEISQLGCKIYYDYMKLILDNHSKEEAYNMIKENDYKEFFSEKAVSVYGRILKGNIQDCPENEIKSSGYVVDTLEASLWTVLTTSSYEEAVLKAVNLGDDTDTVGAIAGSIAGLIYGIDNIPAEWIEKLRNKELLDSILERFHQSLS